MVDSEQMMPDSSGWRPMCVREMRERADEYGPLQAMHDTLENDNITVTPGGEVEAVRQHEGGMLFVGNHSRQFEFIALMDFLCQTGRTEMSNVAKFYVEKQAQWAFGPVGGSVTLPVYPRTFDADRRIKLNIELGSRILFHKYLQPGDEARRMTDESLLAASDTLAHGGAVNIFPCGQVVNSLKSPWRSGVGRIILGLPEEEVVRDSVLVVPYHADNIQRLRLVATLAARGRGIFSRPQNINLIFGRPRTVTEVIESIPSGVREIPSAIAEALRQDHIQNFAA